MAERTTTEPDAATTTTGAPEASDVLEDLEALRARLASAEQQRSEFVDLLRRTRADFENYQKRSNRELTEERRYAHAKIVRDLLPVVYNLERAIEAARKQGDESPLVQGVSMVLAQFLETLGRYGVTRIEALGQPFDPTLHEAVGQQPRTDVAPGLVVDVTEPGYRLHDRVLRPTRAVVSAPSGT